MQVEAGNTEVSIFEGQEQGQSGDQEEPGGEQPEDSQESGEANSQAAGAQPGSEDVQAPTPVSETPLTQSQEQSLRRIPDNPGGLLQRKFLQQYQERQTPSDEGDTPW